MPGDDLPGITARTEQQKHVLHFTCEMVSESVYLRYCWAEKQQTQDTSHLIGLAGLVDQWLPCLAV